VEYWLKNFETHWETIRALDPIRFKEKFRRAWPFYLAGAAEIFEAPGEIINCYHITFVKGPFVKGHFPGNRLSTPIDRVCSMSSRPSGDCLSSANISAARCLAYSPDASIPLQCLGPDVSGQR
jgi:hypothetical protein